MSFGVEINCILELWADFHFTVGRELGSRSEKGEQSSPARGLSKIGVTTAKDSFFSEPFLLFSG